jgi:hypothetical protein
MSSGWSVGELGWMRALRRPGAPRSVPGIGWKMRAPIATSSGSSRSLIKHARTWLERPGSSGWMTAGSAVRRKDFNSVRVQSAVRAVRAGSRSAARKACRSSMSGGWASRSRRVVAARRVRAWARAASSAVKPWTASPSLNALAAARRRRYAVHSKPPWTRSRWVNRSSPEVAIGSRYCRPPRCAGGRSRGCWRHIALVLRAPRGRPVRATAEIGHVGPFPDLSPLEFLPA